ncbi:MAG TPA: glycoside hydrolase family 3 C-terminal domain-containing protein [Candidatus Acidoferrales bacterium]|jgi:beta-glucosidase|nr:glycoside hydrolase family 3 C-terminal domain-containing protein [Candidatus Acidoferrales bacterium]
MKQKICIIFSACLCMASSYFALGDALPYQDPKAPVEQRVNDLFGRLTGDEKLSLLGGRGFTTRAIPRLGVPAMAMADAGQGVRGGPRGTTGPATAFPCGVLMASTWDPELIGELGKAAGEEARNKGPGVQVLLGPAVNIHRSPLGGRNAEYFSEDPFLAAQMGVDFIKGVQSMGVSACVKHYACNNEETDRTTVDETVSERALREIYLPAFEAAVKEGKVWSVMSSYNMVNGYHASANKYLLTDILKHDWQFNGEVMSDWGGVHETDVVQAGNDLEMPYGDNMNVRKLKAALADGSVTQAAVDDSVRRILRTIIRVGLLDGPMTPDQSKVNSPEHARLAYEIATKGIVLLKNQGDLLPLDQDKIKSIAVIGESAMHMQVDALGSPQVKPTHVVEILDGIKTEAGSGVTINYAAAPTGGESVPASVVTPPNDSNMHGFWAEYFTNPNLEGNPAAVRVDQTINILDASDPAPGISGDRYSARWTAKLHPSMTGLYNLSFSGDDGYRVYIDGKLLIDRWVQQAVYTSGAQAYFEAGKTYDVRIEYFQNGGDAVAQFKWMVPGQTNYADAVEAAKKSDVAIVCVSADGTDGEGQDRTSMDLPDDQADLIKAVSAANKNTIVVLNTGGPVTMTPWVDQVPALVQAWYPGQEGGDAVAAVLFGKVNPSGKLPDTFAANRADYPDAGNFPDVDNKVTYAEGIYVGYRHFDKDNIQPLFPFGYGLSYTSFKYSDLKLSAPQLDANGQITASMDVQNTGERAGEEVVELYLHEQNPAIDRPVRELKGFAKVALNPGETKTVQFQVSPRALCYYDVDGRQWKADPGQYEIQIGASSRDIRLTAPFSLSETFTQKVDAAGTMATAAKNSGTD